MKQEEHMAYALRRPCGCLCAAAVDDLAHKRDTNKEVARWAREAVRDGCTIEQITCEEVRSGTWGCPICRPEKSASA